jgi:hypothetical protein
MNIFILNQLLYTRTTIPFSEEYTQLLLAESKAGIDPLLDETNEDPLLTNAFNLVDEAGNTLLYENSTILMVAE